MTNSKHAWTGSVSSLTPAIRSSIHSMKKSRILEDRKKYFKAQIDNYTAEIKIYKGILEIDMSPSTATTLGIVLNFILTFTIAIFIFYIWIWIDLFTAWYFLSSKPNDLSKKLVKELDRRSRSGFQIELKSRHFPSRELISIFDVQISRGYPSVDSSSSTSSSLTRTPLTYPSPDEILSARSTTPSRISLPESISKSIKCPNCGNECPTDDNFCQYCGRLLEK